MAKARKGAAEETPVMAISTPLSRTFVKQIAIKRVERRVLDRMSQWEVFTDGSTDPIKSDAVFRSLPGPERVVLESDVGVVGWMIRWDELTPSQNVLMREYGNPHKYKKLIESWTQIFWAAMANGQIPKATQKRRLTITRFVTSERYRLDRGNLVGGCKPLLDAAVKAQLIRDDREGDLDDHYHQAIDPRDSRVEIIVEDI